MKKKEVTEVHVKACRKPRFKAGAGLSDKVNRIVLNVDQTIDKDADTECLDIELKWESESEDLDGIEM